MRWYAVDTEVPLLQHVYLLVRIDEGPAVLGVFSGPKKAINAIHNTIRPRARHRVLEMPLDRLTASQRGGLHVFRPPRVVWDSADLTHFEEVAGEK
jgi:hypothetical protein